MGQPSLVFINTYLIKIAVKSFKVPPLGVMSIVLQNGILRKKKEEVITRKNINYLEIKLPLKSFYWNCSAGSVREV